jgi:hypothetical protein
MDRDKAKTKFVPIQEPSFSKMVKILTHQQEIVLRLDKPDSYQVWKATYTNKMRAKG